MTTKIAPTKRTNKTNAKARAASSIRPVPAPSPFTEDDVRKAVERSRDLLRYRYSTSTADRVIAAWATLREFNTRRPDLIQPFAQLRWDFVGSHPEWMMATALCAARFDRTVLETTEPCLEWIGCVQRVDDVKALHKIWSKLNVPVGFDVLGEMHMALLHD